MDKKYFYIGISILALLASILACNAPITTVTSVPVGGGGSPEPGTMTDTPELPPPAIATLRVAYIKGDNIWLWTEGTGSSQLTTVGDAMDPVLSEDGQVLAFLRSGEVWAVNADGSDERQLVSATFLSTLATPGDTAEVKDLVWMPGSHTIYFNTLVIAGEAGYRIPQVDLYSVKADGDGDAITTQESPGSGGVPYFSPDGTIVALAQPDKIIFMEVTGAYWNVALTFPKILTYSEWMYVPDVVWLPDSSGVWVVIPASDPLSDPTQPSTFWNVPISGSPSVQTTFVAVPAFASAPVISPDGSKVLYLGESGGEDNLQVLQVDGLDTGYTFAESGQVGIVNWSPDSTHFVYWLPQPATTYIAAVGEIAYNVSDTSPIAIAAQWIDDNRVIYIGDSGELRYRTVDGISSLIDAGVNEYNFAFWVH